MDDRLSRIRLACECDRQITRKAGAYFGDLEPAIELLVVVPEDRQPPDIHRRRRHLDATLVVHGMLEIREQVQALVEQAAIVDFKTVGERWKRLAVILYARRFRCGDHSPRFFDLSCACAQPSE